MTGTVRTMQRMLICVDEGVSVSAIAEGGADAAFAFVLAHGAGAGMEHPFMTGVAQGLSARNVATLRFQFPFMERKAGGPDRPPLAHATIRAAIGQAHVVFPGIPLFAGGKSYGGRMTSQAQALAPLPGVGGIVFLGFPMNAPGKPAQGRTEHLHKVRVPMLFVQGTRDKLAEIGAMEELVHELGELASLKTIAEADHSYHVPHRSGRTDDEVMVELLDAVVTWMQAQDGSCARPRPRLCGG